MAVHCSAQGDKKRIIKVLLIAGIRRLSADKMVQYFWAALATDNAIVFSKKMKAEVLLRFKDMFEEFRDRFNDEWLKK